MLPALTGCSVLLALYAAAAPAPHTPRGDEPTTPRANQGAVLAPPPANADDDGDRDASPPPKPPAHDDPIRLESPETLSELPTLRGRPLEGLQRIAHRFAFEESEAVPLEMPVNFYRRIAADEGFLPFGTMHPDNTLASQGKWSFRFALNGGSMAAVVPSGVVPVLPGASYRISADARTAGLRGARARLAVWLHDREGKIIPGSRAESALTNSVDWTRLTTVIPGTFPNATDLGLELQLVQERHYRSGDAHSILPEEDLEGLAWFDDVVVEHVPRVDLTTGRPGQLIPAGETAIVRMRIVDLTSENLASRLQVRDIGGNVVYAGPTTDAPAGWRALSLPALPAGWYEAMLDVIGEDRRLSRHTLSFCVLGPRGARDASVGANASPTFSIVLDARSVDARDASLLPLVQQSGATRVTWPAWARGDDRFEITARFEAAGRILDTLLAQHISLCLQLEAVPRDVAEAQGLDAMQVIDLLSRSDEQWRPWLDAYLQRFGLQASQWALSRGSVPLDDPHVGAMLRAAQRNLARYAAAPVLELPWPAEREANAPQGVRPLLIVPWQMQPDALPDLLQSRDQQAPAHITLEPLPLDRFTPRQQAIDLALRAAHALRAGVGQIEIAAPWSQPDAQQELEPTPLYPVLRTLSEQLRGRRFAGELPLGPELTCWVLEGIGQRSSALLAWRRSELAPSMHDPASPASASPASGLRMVLGAHDVQTSDILGRREQVPLTEAGHVVPLSDLPAFIENIDVNLAKLRSSFAMESNFIPAERRVHEHAFVLRNPWPTSLSGTLQLRASERCGMQPRILSFNIGAGEEMRLPVQITFDGRIEDGPFTILADAELQAERSYRITLRADASIGLADVQAAGQWRIAGSSDEASGDLIVTHIITNRRATPLSVESYLRAPNTSHRRTVLGVVEPGATVMAEYRLENAQLIMGETLWLGLIEQAGMGEVMTRVTLPARTNESLTVSADSALYDERHSQP